MFPCITTRPAICSIVLIMLSNEKGTGLICAKHPSGRSGKLAPSPFRSLWLKFGRFVEYFILVAAA